MNTPAPENPFRNILVFLFTIGLGCTSIAVYFIADSWSFVNRASHADGVVVGRKMGPGLSEIRPIVTFKTPSGAGFKFQSNVPTKYLERFPIGTRVDVLYDPHDPSKASINSLTDLWGLAFCFGGIGLVGLALGSLALVQSARISQRRRAVVR
jgi:hypothetical protein